LYACLLIKHVSDPSDDCQCGIANHKGRIVGGTKASPNEYPWQIALFRKGSFSCGGSLISNKWVITATHCVVHKNEYIFTKEPPFIMPKPYNISDFTVRLGAHDLNETESTAKTIKVSRIVQHPNYIGTNIVSNDITLLELAEEVNYTKAIRPVCLPQDPQKGYAQEMATTSGWGHSGEKHEILKKLTDLKIHERGRCMKDEISTSDWNSIFCAGGNAKEGTCFGDSGGKH
jgi:secreted trypsin-like serine protease